MIRNISLILFSTSLIFFSCTKEDDQSADFPAPEISIAPDTKVYLPGETATVSIDVEAPGRLKEVKIGSETITNFGQELSVKGITAEYLIPLEANGNHIIKVIAIDQQVTAKTDTAEVVLKINGDPCKSFDAYGENYVAEEGWELVFEDNFNSDLSKWEVWSGGAYNNELQHYQPENVEIVDGALVISAKRETVRGTSTNYDDTPKTFDFTSGRLESNTTISANETNPKVRMVARIKWPQGVGLWPAFWSYGDPWPTQGEIDVLEARGSEPMTYHTNYFYGTETGKNLVRNAEGHIKTDTDLTACYHVYEMVWEKDKLTSYLDGEVVEVKTRGGYIDDMFGLTQRIVLNLAVGGDFFADLDPSTIEEGRMFVDYVKVYTSN